MQLLRQEACGGCRDWSLLQLIEVAGAGGVEDLAKKQLAALAVPRRYYKGDTAGGQETIEQDRSRHLIVELEVWLRKQRKSSPGTAIQPKRLITVG